MSATKIGLDVAQPVPSTEDSPQWLVEVAQCASCGKEVQRTVGQVTSRGAHRRWSAHVVASGSWVHSVSFVASCRAEDVAAARGCLPSRTV